MKRELESKIAAAVSDLFDVEIAIDLTRPEEQFGDYATNVALQLSKQIAKNPREVAETLSTQLSESLATQVKEVSVAGPGFINLTLTDLALQTATKAQPSKSLAGQTIVVEYSDPNPFKILHVGHVYTTIVGDAIANLMESAGGEIHRVNFGGDVGLHVGKTMWAIIQRLGGEFPNKLNEIAEPERPSWMAAAYVEGNTAYEADEQTKLEIVALNKRVYQLHSKNDQETLFAKIYWTCRQWSYDAFDAFYERLGTHLEKYYPESETSDLGLKLVKEQIGKVFEESDGAVIFRGEAYGLHTRVFINREGLPTYEAKDVGLIVKKHEDYKFDRSVVVTANEQQQYMAVVLKAIEQFLPDLARATTYVPHGMVKLAGGLKMSSRKGNIISANEVLDATAEANRKLSGKDDDRTMLGAIKYAFLKNRIGGDLVYEPKESVSLEGNSGPYLQYAHARAQSILRKAGELTESVSSEQRSTGIASRSPVALADYSELTDSVSFETGERSLARKLTEYSEVVDKAVPELAPHLVCTYLYDLAQIFNRFYEHNRVLGDDRQQLRLALVEQYAQTLKSGLRILGIQAPDTM